MNHRITSSFGFLGSVAAATLAAAVMTGQARAEGPIEDIKPIAGVLSRAEVQAAVMANRSQITSFASELYSQQQAPVLAASGYTRQEARAAFLASREEVRAMNSEGGGAGYVARAMHRASATEIAARQQ